MKRTVSNFGGLIAGVALMGIAATQLLGAPGDAPNGCATTPIGATTGTTIGANAGANTARTPERRPQCRRPTTAA